MDASKFMSGLIGMAKLAAPLIPYGPQAVAVANSVLGAMNDAKETANATPEKLAEFEQERTALEAAVNAHATKTAESLGDG